MTSAARQRTRALLALALSACAAEPITPSQFEEPPPPAPPPDDAEPVFDPTTIADITLTMDPADWDDIRTDPRAARWHEATFTWRGEQVDRVAVRAFGMGSVVVGKPSLKLSFDRVVDDRRWRGLETLKLDNSSQDPTFLNERLCTEVMRAAGVPAARTGYATVAVNGEHAGFFVVLESIDDPFLARWFGDDDGALYGTVQGAYGQGLMPLDEPLKYYDPQDKDTGDGADLARLARLVADGTDAELAAAIDLPGFFRHSVTRSVLGGHDSFSADGNNFYLYDDRGTWRIIPWDFDYDLATDGVATALSLDPRAPWATSRWAADSLTGEPYVDPLLVRALAMGADPDAVIAELLVGPLRWRELDAEVVATAALIRDAVIGDVLDHGPTFDRHVAELRMFLHARLSQFAGRDVADCPPAPAGTRRAAELAPQGAVGWGSLSIDGTSWGPGFSVAGEHFCTGLFAHAPSAVTLQLPAGHDTLRGKAGLQDWDQACGDGVVFSIVQDGAVLWDSGLVRGYEPARGFEVAVVPGEVVLTVDAAGDHTCDTAAWLDVAAE